MQLDHYYSILTRKLVMTVNSLHRREIEILVKKQHPLDDDIRTKLTDILKGLKCFGDPLTDFKRNYKPTRLKKKGDIEYEVHCQTFDIEKDGHKVLHVAGNRYGESIMVYRLFYGDALDERDIHLRVKVITNKGVLVPDSNVYLIVHPESKHMQIADIRIEGDRVNRGYGSIMMAALMNLVQQLGIKYITGWISGVDWDHVERSEHFYKKFGFECILDHEIKYGTITWLNGALGATKDELRKLKDIK